MSIPAWPVSLPQKLLISGAGGAPPDIALRSAVDAGPAKVRRRFTAGIEPVKGEMLLTYAQWSTFQTFYNATTLGGSLRFSWAHPLTSAAVEMRFTSAPAWAADGRLIKLSLSLEILP